jgi:hypothetical protein
MEDPLLLTFAEMPLAPHDALGKQDGVVDHVAPTCTTLPSVLFFFSLAHSRLAFFRPAPVRGGVSNRSYRPRGLGGSRQCCPAKLVLIHMLVIRAITPGLGAARIGIIPPCLRAGLIATYTVDTSTVDTPACAWHSLLARAVRVHWRTTGRGLAHVPARASPSRHTHFSSGQHRCGNVRRRL